MCEVQEIVEENGEIVVVPTKQHIPGMETSDDVVEYRVEFGQVWISKPPIKEYDGSQVRPLQCNSGSCTTLVNTMLVNTMLVTQCWWDTTGGNMPCC